jgi:hypothetical protein
MSSQGDTSPDALLHFGTAVDNNVSEAQFNIILQFVTETPVCCTCPAQELITLTISGNQLILVATILSLFPTIDLILPAQFCPRVDSASNRNEYQEFSWV